VAYRALFVRADLQGHEYNQDALDPLLWTNSDYLVKEPALSRALAALDRLAAVPASSLSPVRRAMLQRDLWAAFDWAARRPAAPPSSGEARLAAKLAQEIRRLALPRVAIAALPDTLAATHDPALPADLFDPAGPWVLLGDGASDEPLAVAHLATFDRSLFFVLIALPAGRAATLAYLAQLGAVPQPVHVENGRPVLDRALPQFPVGTRVALVRRLVLVDRDGELVATPLTESVQLRRYDVIGAAGTPADNVQTNYEWQLRRADLFAGRLALHAITPDEREFNIFLSHGLDWFDQEEGGRAVLTTYRPILQKCHDCHGQGNEVRWSAPGLHSVQSYARLFHPTRIVQPPRLTAITVADETARTLRFIRAQPGFQRLRPR
jgi:hypothetical protein